VGTVQMALPLSIIINADDLGASTRVNDAIFRELDANRVTSASIIANSPAFPECLKKIPAYKKSSFGVHLNLLEYAPLTSSPALNSLLSSEGLLGEALRYRRFSPRQLAAIHSEFAAQIRRVAQSGVRVSHIDSHWHVHTRPDFLPMIKSLQREFEIARVRARLNLYPRNHPPRLRNRIAISLYNAALRLPTAALTTDCMSALSIFVDRLSSGWQPRFSSVEIMVHPGACAEPYASETALLSTNWLSLLSRPWRLINFWDL